jgi:hypothetical protein
MCAGGAAIVESFLEPASSAGILDWGIFETYEVANNPGSRIQGGMWFSYFEWDAGRTQHFQAGASPNVSVNLSAGVTYKSRCVVNISITDGQGGGPLPDTVNQHVWSAAN